MGALGHFLEGAGIPTTQISQIREHTEKIRPPRALWVPFELGRLLGVPDDPEFQKRVLIAALGLLAAESGPVLVDFGEDAPIDNGEGEILACPYLPGEDSSTDPELIQDLKREIAGLQPWYRQVRGDVYRSEISLSKKSLVSIAEELGAVLAGLAPGDSLQLRYGIEDLKAYYFTALGAQPGLSRQSGDATERWFWQETTAGSVLRQLQKSCRESEDQTLQKISRQIIPSRYLKELEV